MKDCQTRSLISILALLVISSLFIGSTLAATPDQIEQSVQSGVQWLANNQKADGSWGDSYLDARTAFGVLKLEDRAMELGYSSPFDPAYPYHENVERGLQYLFNSSNLEFDSINQTLSFGEDHAKVYSTSVALMAICKSISPLRVVNAPGSPIDTWTYLKVSQYAQNYLVKAQKANGGWGYELGTNSAPDNSNSGYAALGLAYAQQLFGISIPQATLIGIDNWISFIQCPSDGSSGYMGPCDWPNILKTGNLLFQMYIVGDVSTTARAQNATHYIENHWNDANWDPGWKGPGWAGNWPHYQATYAMMKGFEAMKIETINVSSVDVDWFDVVSTAIVNTQNADGSWNQDQWGDQILATEWALLTLERVVESSDPRFDTMKSFEDLLRDQHILLASFDNLMGKTPATRMEKIEFLYSIEDLIRRQAVGMGEFDQWIEKNWENLTPKQRWEITDSLEDLLRRQAKNLEAFNGGLLAWVRTFDPVYRQRFSDSFEDLLHRQARLLKKFEYKLHQNGMQTPEFLRSFEDLLRRQAMSLEGFGNLGEFTFDSNKPKPGPAVSAYKTADKTSVFCGDEITYNYTVYNSGDEELTNISVYDQELPNGLSILVGIIPSLGIYQSEKIERTRIVNCSPLTVYPTTECDQAKAIGMAGASQVEAESNELCIILNGWRLSGQNFNKSIIFQGNATQIVPRLAEEQSGLEVH